MEEKGIEPPFDSRSKQRCVCGWEVDVPHESCMALLSPRQRENWDAGQNLAPRLDYKCPNCDQYQMVRDEDGSMMCRWCFYEVQG